MMDAGFDRQRMPRHLLRTDCQVVRERDFRLVADRLHDVSLTGLCVTPAEPVMTGDRLIVSFRLPNSDTWVDAEATVARVIHGRRPGEHTRALGLVFEVIDEDAHLALARKLLERPLAPPGRATQSFESKSLARLLSALTRASHDANPN